MTESEFELFAARFVRGYWRAVKSGRFSMPPDEPVPESLDELLSEVAYEIDSGGPPLRGEAVHRLRMWNLQRDTWTFTFRAGAGDWELTGALSKSDGHRSDDLLGPVYGEYFGPFLASVTRAANGVCSEPGTHPPRDGDGTTLGARPD